MYVCLKRDEDFGWRYPLDFVVVVVVVVVVALVGFTRFVAAMMYVRVDGMDVLCCVGGMKMYDIPTTL